MTTTVDHNYGNERKTGIPPLLAVPIAGTVLIKIKDTDDKVVGETTSTPQGIWRESFELEDGSYVVEFSGRFRPIGLGSHSAYTKPVPSLNINIVVPLISIGEPSTGTGQDGATGPSGPEGPIGTEGPAGPKGDFGEIGATGPEGPTGDEGPMGAPGVPGIVGPAGSQGSQGVPGPSGAQGASGTVGTQGPIGATGPSAGDACEVSLGLPQDGYWSDGLLGWESDTTVCNALDDVNEILAALAPDQPLPLEGASLAMTGVSLFDGYASEKEYQNYKSAAGESVDGTYTGGKIIISEEFTLTNPTVGDPDAGGDDTFYPGDLGTLSSRITSDGVEEEKGSIDLVTGTPSYDESLTLNAQNIYNDFSLWMRGDATIDANGYLSSGYNKIIMRHNVNSNADSEEYEVFYDTATTSVTATVAPAATENIPIYRELSGIRSYTTNSVFNLSVSTRNMFDDTYQTDAFLLDISSFPGAVSATIALTDPAWNGTISSPTPRYDDIPVLTDYEFTVTVADQRSVNAGIGVTIRKPGRANVTNVEFNPLRLIDTFSDSSTPLDEPFDDEDYRLDDNDGSAYPNNYDSDPVSIIDNWLSSYDLVDGDAVVFHGSLYHPSSASLPGGGDFTGRLPFGPDYSSFSSDAVYLRAFEDAGDPHSNGILELAGLTGSDVSPVGSGNINVEIKLPTETGWLDLGSTFNVALFTGADGDGCRSSQSGDDWGFTFGTFSTADSDYTVIVRITIKNTSSVISRMRITDW